MIMSLLAFAAVLLIAYWWANTGAFSALVHMMCVITAGAVAFAIWEPVSYRLLESPVEGHAKGLVLIGTFVGLTALLRLLTDKFIPMNLNFPRAADVAVGGAFGLASGILSVGIMIISMGYFQSTVTIGDYTGWSRRSDVPTAPTIGSDNAPMLHIASATASFYGYLSWGSFTPWLGGGTFATHSPDLFRQSASINRDSFGEGQGRIAIQPGAVSDLVLLDVPAAPLSGAVGSAPAAAWAVSFTVAQDGYDGGGQQFVLTAAQARVIGNGKNASSVHPVAWSQPTPTSPMGYFFFSSPSNMVTSIPSQGESKCVLLFPKSEFGAQAPKYFEIKGVRYLLPAPKSGAELLAAGTAAAAAGARGKRIEDPDATDISALCDFPDPYYAIGGTVINSNEKGNLVTDGANFVVSGEQKFPRDGSANVSPELRVRGFQVQAGQRILRMNASATAEGVRIFPDLNEWIRSAGAEAQDARVCVIDDAGAKYYAVGLVEDDGEWVFVRSMGGKPLRIRDIPIQPLGSGKKLFLHFRVPSGANIRGLMLVSPSGDRVVNDISVTVPKEQ